MAVGLARKMEACPSLNTNLSAFSCDVLEIPDRIHDRDCDLQE
jgi:hypothetical protein